jgi:hypothetical protein
MGRLGRTGNPSRQVDGGGPRDQTGLMTACSALLILSPVIRARRGEEAAQGQGRQGHDQHMG